MEAFFFCSTFKLRMKWLAFSFLFIAFSVNGQDSSSLKSWKKPVVLSGMGGIWAGTLIGLSTTYYSQDDRSSFHFFDDSREWLQMDKAGHLYTSAHLGELSYSFLNYAGYSKKHALLFGTLAGLGYQTSLEVLDGFGNKWGFSWSDMGANLLGSSFFYFQQRCWGEQKLRLKMSAHYSPYSVYNPNVLGMTKAERLLKDYNGQSYWLSGSLGHIRSFDFFPKWLCLSVGYSINQKIYGTEDVAVFDGQIFRAQRQLLFSLDLDIDKLPIQKKWLKSVLQPLKWIKIPFPTLVVEKGTLTFSPIYF